MTNKILELIADLNLNANETQKHLENVQVLTTSLLEEIERKKGIPMESSYKNAVIQASMLHDIGKASIPKPILYKEGLLSDSERMIVETHPLTGIYILKKILSRDDFINEHSEKDNEIIGNVILYHHEKWDGSGYPNGIKGKDIPLESRIITIVDIFDALTSERCYKKAWTVSDALAYLKEGKGTFFDPFLVECFIQMKEQERLTA